MRPARLGVGQLVLVRHRQRPGRAGLDAQSAEDAAQVVDLVDAAVALTRRVPLLVGVVGPLDVDRVRGTGPGAQLAADALLQPVGVPVELVPAVPARLRWAPCRPGSSPVTTRVNIVVKVTPKPATLSRMLAERCSSPGPRSAVGRSRPVSHRAPPRCRRPRRPRPSRPRSPPAGGPRRRPPRPARLSESVCPGNGGTGYPPANGSRLSGATSCRPPPGRLRRCRLVGREQADHDDQSPARMPYRCARRDRRSCAARASRTPRRPR